MEQIQDDPIIACIERTGYPPWFFDRNGKLLGEEEDDEDVQEEDWEV